MWFAIRSLDFQPFAIVHSSNVLSTVRTVHLKNILLVYFRDSGKRNFCIRVILYFFCSRIRAGARYPRCTSLFELTTANVWRVSRKELDAIFKFLRCIAAFSVTSILPCVAYTSVFMPIKTAPKRLGNTSSHGRVDVSFYSFIYLFIYFLFYTSRYNRCCITSSTIEF